MKGHLHMRLNKGAHGCHATGRRQGHALVQDAWQLTLLHATWHGMNRR
jgi:hypothetical protein